MLLADDLDQQAFLPHAVELIVEDVFPRSQVELSIRDGDNDLTPHDLSFQMGIGVVLSTIVLVLGMGLLRSELLQPDLIVVVQARLVVVDENRCCYVHRVHQYKTIPNAALRHQSLNFVVNGNDGPTPGHVHPNFFCQRFHT